MNHPGVKYLKPNEHHTCIIDPSDVRRAPRELIDLINKLGNESSRTQGLSHTITTFENFENSENRLYILLDDSDTIAVGFLKVGFKHLFIFDEIGGQHEITPLCLLDFFICNGIQRKGYGKKMYDAMLENEHIEPQMIAIDRPSKLCLSFMRKHFGLENYVPQNNKFVVFNEYFQHTKAAVHFSTPQKGPGHRPLESSTQAPYPATPQKQRYNPITWEPL